MIPAGQPRAPKADQNLAIAAPASAFDRQAFADGLETLGTLLPGREVRIDPEVYATDGYFAGPDQDRAAHLARLMADPVVGAVICARGGFGTSRLLPLLDLPALVDTETLLMGFSDLTALLNPLAARGLSAVHGPVVTQLPRLDQPSREEVATLLSGLPLWPSELAGHALSPGKAAGPLMGGNLTLLCHLLGTEYFPPLEGAVLFLEDTNEAPYRLDRLITQLELAGVLDAVAGFALGWLSQAEDPDPALYQAAARRLLPLGKPVVSRLPFGHASCNRCLPMGALAELDGDAGTLRVGVEFA